MLNHLNPSIAARCLNKIRGKESSLKKFSNFGDRAKFFKHLETILCLEVVEKCSDELVDFNFGDFSIFSALKERSGERMYKYLLDICADDCLKNLTKMVELLGISTKSNKSDRECLIRYIYSAAIGITKQMTDLDLHISFGREMNDQTFGFCGCVDSMSYVHDSGSLVVVSILESASDSTCAALYKAVAESAVYLGKTSRFYGLSSNLFKWSSFSYALTKNSVEIVRMPDYVFDISNVKNLNKDLVLGLLDYIARPILHNLNHAFLGF